MDPAPSGKLSVTSRQGVDDCRPGNWLDGFVRRDEQSLLRWERAQRHVGVYKLELEAGGHEHISAGRERVRHDVRSSVQSPHHLRRMEPEQSGAIRVSLEVRQWHLDSDFDEHRSSGGPGWHLVLRSCIAKAVFYGGLTGSFSTIRSIGQTWVLNASGFNERDPSPNPGPLTFPQMVYDPAIKGVLLWGGYDQGASLHSSTWVFD